MVARMTQGARRRPTKTEVDLIETAAAESISELFLPPCLTALLT